MDRNKFIERFQTIEPMSREAIDKAIEVSIEANVEDGLARGHRDIIIVAEELAELTQELSKLLRGKGNATGILEEMADVLEVLFAICEARGYSVEELMQVKESKREKRGGFKERIYWNGNEE